MGDYNINTLKNIPTNVNTSEFNNLMAEHLVYSIINKPTRVAAHTASIIDNIYTNTMIPTNTGILSCDISDHFPIFCVFNDLPMSVDKPTITKRRLNKESIKKFNKALQFINWHIIDDYDIQTALTMFQGVIDLLFDEFCPKQTITMAYSNKLP